MLFGLGKFKEKNESEFYPVGPKVVKSAGTTTHTFSNLDPNYKGKYKIEGELTLVSGAVLDLKINNNAVPARRSLLHYAHDYGTDMGKGVSDNVLRLCETSYSKDYNVNFEATIYPVLNGIRLIRSNAIGSSTANDRITNAMFINRFISTEDISSLVLVTASASYSGKLRLLRQGE